MRYVLCIALFLFSANSMQARLKNKDSFSRQQEKLADSLTSRNLLDSLDSTAKLGNINAALDIYMNLAAKYEYWDFMRAFYLSVKAEHSEAFYISCKEFILRSGDSAETVISGYANTWGGNDLSVLKKEPLTSAIRRIKKEEGKLVQQARANLSWAWNVELPALFKANIEFRYIDQENFKDKATYYTSMVETDSIHLFEFCDLVEQHGYPSFDKVGYRANMVYPLFLHFAALIGNKDKEKAQVFVDKWRFLIPQLYTAVKDKGGSDSYYRIIYERVMNGLTHQDRQQNITYFKKYELAD